MSNPRVKIDLGELEGLETTNCNGFKYYSFRGVPYAEPPIKELRFMPPVPKKPWKGVKNATAEGNECSQIQMLATKPVGKEDCLFLNVHTPSLPREGAALLPVLVHIHGGGFINGSGNMDVFNADYIIEMDTILVTINYRLGALGFLCLNIPEAAGNAGLKDQNLALQWIQQHIKHFNGDPENVTLFGISAGGASVEYHMLSPMSKGLFKKAILQSGTALSPWVRTRDPIQLTTRLVKSLNGPCDSPENMWKFLMELEPNKIVTAAFNLKNDEDLRRTEFFSFTPVVEKKLNEHSFLTEEPLKLLRTGNFYKVPTLTGFCEKEGTMFKFFYEKALTRLAQQRYIDYVPSYFVKDKEVLDEVLRGLYKKQFEDKNPQDMINDFLTDLLFLGGITNSLRYRMPYSEQYFYRFTYEGTLNMIKKVFNIKEHGACHGDDSGYLARCFYIDEKQATETDMKVRSRMVSMWTNFAKCGNPTPEKTFDIKVLWPVAKKEKILLMDIGKQLTIKTFPYKDRMKLWDELYGNIAT